MAKITEATRTVTQLYSLSNMIILQHGSRYCAMELSEMLEQSYTQMLKLAMRWKPGIYHSMKQAKLLWKKITILIIWRLLDPD